MCFKKYVEVVLGSSKGHHLYDTRHTLLITVFHVDVKIVSMLMGHSNIDKVLYTLVTHVSHDVTRVDKM